MALKLDKLTANLLLEDVLREYKREQYKTNPALWLEERFGEPLNTLQWSLWDKEVYANHKWDGSPEPFYQAFEALVKKEWVGIESATSTGKTYLLPRIVYWFLDVFPNALVVTTAPKQQQLKDVLWSEMSKCFHKFKKIRPNAEMYSLRVLPEGAMHKINKKQAEDEEEMKHMHMAIGVVAGVRADEESATKMQGYHRENMLFIVEEAAGVPPPIFTAIKNTSTGHNNLVVAVGNPDSVTDSLHQFCELRRVRHIRISGYDHPNVVLGRPVIPGAVTQLSIDDRKDEYGEESNFFKSRVRGIAPKQAADALILYDWIMACAPGTEEYKKAGEIAEDRSSYNALGVDVANSENGDMACLAWGRANALVQLQEFHCRNANHIAHNVIFDEGYLIENRCEIYGTSKLADYQVDQKHIGVDSVGVGVGTVNAFHDFNYEVVGLQGGPWQEAYIKDHEDKPLYEFTSLRAQMYFQARLDIMKREIVLDVQPKILKALVKELTTIKYTTNQKSIVIEAKQDIKKRLGKSPNMADAFVYWNWIRKNRKGYMEEMPFTYAGAPSGLYS